MNRFLSCLLALCLLFSAAAQAEVIKEPEPEITIDRVYRTLSLDGEKSLTHGWIVAEVTITNYSLHTISVKDDLSGTLVYDGLYQFTAEPVFAVSEFEPLVRLSGQMVFEVPKLVLEAKADRMDVTLSIDGKTMPVEMNSDRKTMDASASVSFDTPEELLVAFIDCLKNADFENLLTLFSHKEKARHLHFDRYLSIMRTIQISGTVFPDYEAYDALNALNQLSTYQINTMIYSLFSEIESNGTTFAVKYNNDTVTGMMVFTGEEMTAQEYIDRMNPEHLSSLTLESIGRMPIDPESRQRKNNMRNSLIYDYSDIREYILRVSFDGETYYLGATLCRFPEGWKIDSLMCQTFYQNNNIGRGEFAKEERVDDFDFDQLIYTWEKGEVISENLLKEPEDLTGTWIFDIGLMVIDEDTIKLISNEDSEEAQYVFRISEENLYLFESDLRDSHVCRITLSGDMLTLYAGDESLSFQRLNK